MNKAAQKLGRLGGKKTSEAKAAAARENGAKGGRPKTKKAKRLSKPENKEAQQPSQSEASCGQAWQHLRPVRF
jgi:hypothetical protein